MLGGALGLVCSELCFPMRLAAQEAVPWTQLHTQACTPHGQVPGRNPCLLSESLNACTSEHRARGRLVSAPSLPARLSSPSGTAQGGACSSCPLPTVHQRRRLPVLGFTGPSGRAGRVRRGRDSSTCTGPPGHYREPPSRIAETRQPRATVPDQETDYVVWVGEGVLPRVHRSPPVWAQGLCVQSRGPVLGLRPLSPSVIRRLKPRATTGLGAQRETSTE